MHEHEPGRQHERDPEAEGHEAMARDDPRIYVASLSDYNNGILHGRWIEITGHVETMHEEIAAMLRMSPTTAKYGDVAEEWAIHDYDGFGELVLGEYESLKRIAKLASGIVEHGLAFAAWMNVIGDDVGDESSGSEGDRESERFSEQFLGSWKSVEEYAEDLLQDMGANELLAKIPEWLQPYLTLDTAGFARDLQLGGDVSVVENPEGGVWVFRGE